MQANDDSTNRTRVASHGLLSSFKAMPGIYFMIEDQKICDIYVDRKLKLIQIGWEKLTKFHSINK